MLILIPAYNEEQNVGRVAFHCQGYGRVVVIDDGSTDETAAEAQLAGAMVITQGANRGYASALRAGYAYALGQGERYTVQLDADGQHDPGYIPQMQGSVMYGGCDITIGSRYFHGYPMEFPKAVGVLFFRHIIRLTTGLRLTDPTSGYQCLNRRAMEWYLNNPREYPDANAIIGLHRAGLRIKEVPVRMHPNPEGRSMHRGTRKIVRYMGLVVGEIFKVVTR